MGHSKYGTGSNGRRIELSHPEPEERNPHPVQNYYHKHPNLTPEQKERDRQIEAEMREHTKKRLRELSDRLNKNI